MTRPITAEDYADLVDAARSPGFKDWLAMAKSIGGCAEPIHLWGQSTTVHAATGEVLTQRDTGRLLVACGNRRSSRCQPCSEIYRADTYQLIRAGLLGGKGVPETISGHPKVFATFTAPSFGAVHHRPAGSDGQARRCHPFGAHRCGQIHAMDDPILGQPLDPDTYDYVGAVVWNGLATKLWARTVQLINRSVAAQLGIPQRHWPQIGRVSVAKVAEYQARGVVHFHAVIRIDGPEQSDEPPGGAAVETLCQAIERAATTAVVVPPACSGESYRVW